MDIEDLYSMMVILQRNISLLNPDLAQKLLHQNELLQKHTHDYYARQAKLYPNSRFMKLTETQRADMLVKVLAEIRVIFQEVKVRYGLSPQVRGSITNIGTHRLPFYADADFKRFLSECETLLNTDQSFTFSKTPALTF